MIDITKTYRTRCGYPVRIYATDGTKTAPIHGAYKTEHGWDFGLWSLEGKEEVSEEFDLIEVKPRIKRTGWLNVYQDAVFGVYKTREIADGYAMSHRIACIQIPIDCEEGEGLE